MASDNRSKSYTVHQIGALIALLVLAIWGLAVLWIHLVTPAGADRLEMTFLGTLTPIFLILLPLYWKRVRWAYIGGILIVLAMFVGAAKAALDHNSLTKASYCRIIAAICEEGNMAKPFNVTDTTFEAEVLQAAEPTLVDFWAEWCGPCKMVGPAVEAIAEEYDGKLRVAKMDVDANPDIPSGLGILGIPTLILFKAGAEVTRLVGYRPKEALAEALLPYIE